MALVRKVGAQHQLALPSKIYLDTNVLLAAFWGNHQYHKKATILLAAITFKQSKAYLSIKSFDEAWWIIIVEKVAEKKGRRINCNKYIKNHPAFIQSQCKKSLKAFNSFVENNMQSGRFELLDIPASYRHDTYSNMIGIPLVPADALHLTVLRKNGINAIGTADKDFDRVPDSSFEVFSIR